MRGGRWCRHARDDQSGGPSAAAWALVAAAAAVVVAVRAACTARVVAGAATVPVPDASTSTSGLSATTISVAFPVANLDALASTYGFAGDVEYTEQTKAILHFVDQINNSGGSTAARSIRSSPPTTPPTMPRCRRSASSGPQGSPGVFAVRDGVGTFTGNDQLCVTQQADDEDSIEASLGLIPVPFEKALNGQEGVTTETLGGSDDPRPESRVAVTLECGAAGRSGTRPTPGSPRAT